MPCQCHSTHVEHMLSRTPLYQLCAHTRRHLPAPQTAGPSERHACKLRWKTPKWQVTAKKGVRTESHVVPQAQTWSRVAALAERLHTNAGLARPKPFIQRRSACDSVSADLFWTCWGCAWSTKICDAAQQLLRRKAQHLGCCDRWVQTSLVMKGELERRYICMQAHIGTAGKQVVQALLQVIPSMHLEALE